VTTQDPETEQQKRLRAARRVVIKLGTSMVTGEGHFNVEGLAPIARTMAALKKEGRQLVLVSSGAVGLGRGRLGLHRGRLNDLAIRQACAAVGQSLLMHEYETLFQAHGVHPAQVLLTEGDFVDRTRYSNLRETIETLLKLNVLPVVNENDTVSTAELDYLNIRAGERIFSDNDRLAALVMSHIDADVLVLLTDVEGLMEFSSASTAASAKPGNGKVIPLVEEVSASVRALATGPSEGGRGGMLTKLDAAEIAMQSGGVAVIANGKQPDILERIFRGEPVGTVFLSKTRMAGKRRWIAYAAGVRGRVLVNAGAREAVTTGKASLLMSGVIGVEGDFAASEVVSIVNPEGQEFARGIADYSGQDAQVMIRGMAEEAGDSQAGGRANGRARILVKRDNIVLLERKWA
jgi:glutamate 5-kinase